MYKLTKHQALTINSHKDKAVVSSLRISELTGKDHSNVMKDCRKVFKALDRTEGSYSVQYKPEDTNRTFTTFLLPALELDAVTTGYSIDYRVELLSELHARRKETNITSSYTSKDTDNESVGFEETEPDLVQSHMDIGTIGFKESPTKAQLILLAMKQNQQLIDMIKDIDEPVPIDTIVVNDETKLSDLVGGKTSRALKIVGL